MGHLLDELVKNINKAQKEEIFTKGMGAYEYQRIPFSSIRMNYCTYGGLPMGKVIEFYGEEHSGKTTSALDIVANYQRLYPDKEVMYIDAENALDYEWAKKLGVDSEKMYILHPQGQSAEEIFQIIYDAVDTGEVGLWILDSIGVLVSQQEYDKTLEDKTYGGVSKSLTLFAKKIEMLMNRYNCTGIGINQIRENMNSPYGGIVTPGGKAWKHVCMVRMEFRKGEYIDEKGNKLATRCESPCGNVVQMLMVKNKTCKPDRRLGSYTINYEKGIDTIFDLIDVAVAYNVVEKRGAWFYVTDLETGEILCEKVQGQGNLYKFIEENEDVKDRIEELVNQCIVNQ